MIIILIGYMGSGKSTIGYELSKTLNYELIDLDDYIEKKENLTIARIFESKGEIYFRKMEHVYLKELLSKDTIVLSLGGGTPCYGQNMKMVLETENARSIYLKCSLPNLVERLRYEKSKRPLIAHLKTDEELTEFIGKHLFERAYYYSQSHKTLVTDGKTVSAIAEEIVADLY